MKDLRITFILFALAVIAASQLAVLAMNAWSMNTERFQEQGAQVELAARLAGEHYVTRRTQNAQLAQRLSSDADLARHAFRGSIEKIDRRVRSLTPLAKEEFVAFADADGRVFAVTTGLDSVVTPERVTAAFSGQAPLQDLKLVDVGGRIAATHAVSLNVNDAQLTLLAGFDVAGALERTLNTAIGQKVGLRLAQNSGGDAVSFALDKANGVTLAAEFEIQAAPLWFKDSGLWKLAAQSLLVLSFAALVCAVGFSRLFTQRVERPVHGIRRAIRTIQNGRLQEPVRREACAPFHNVAHDLDSMREAICDRENRIMHHAEYDALTGLTNRTVIAEKLKMAMSRAERNGTVISALAIDLSRFSEINGSMGHEVGDEVLKEIARRLASNARVTDTVARVGGDEFFIILEDNDVKLAQSLAKFMVSSLTSAIHVNGSEIKLNAHAGVAFFPQHCDSAEALRRMANIGLYTAKEHGKPLVIYEPGQDEKHLRELAIIHDLPNAIKNNELYLQYQPKIDMETQQVKQVEALVRWRHPQLGFIPPDEFIALLEKSGMINRLTNWVFKEAIRQARVWIDAGYDLGIAVNISANDLSDEKLAERLKLLLHHYLVDASKITIEVTESAVIKDPENSVKVLNELRAAGVRCSLDDFGTGQTSLALLKQLPISEIKIDKSFVQNLRADSGDAIIVKSIIDLGHNMGLHVTAEGVESNYCWNLLNSYGCNLIQGYLVSAPLTADELAEWHLRLQDRHMNKLDLSFVHDMTG